MAVEAISWEGTDTDRKPSASIWGRCPWNSINEGKVNGVAIWDDFKSFNVTPATTEGNWAANAGYAQFSSTGGTITAPAISASTTAGLASSGITIGSDDINEGVAIRTLSVPFALNRANLKMWFECRIQKSSIANTIADTFIGLGDNTASTASTPFSAAATLADHNLFGFWSKSTAGGNCAVSYKAAGVSAVDISTTDITMVAATYTKLGFKYELTGDPAGQYILSFYQDGVRLGTTKQMPTGNGTDFPNNVSLGLLMAIRNAAGSSPGTMTVQWWRAAQLIAPQN